VEQDAYNARLAIGSIWIAEGEDIRTSEDVSHNEVIQDGLNGNDEPVHEVRTTWQPATIATVPSEWNRPHIARWDPERVLVECDTKRKRIELHSGGHECSVFDQNDEVDSCRYVHAGDYCSTLLLEARPFAGRPGFQEEWRSVQITW
jgi:hypothetical protein